MGAAVRWTRHTREVPADTLLTKVLMQSLWLGFWIANAHTFPIRSRAPPTRISMPCSLLRVSGRVATVTVAPTIL
jgi:hypothetical protein